MDTCYYCKKSGHFITGMVGATPEAPGIWVRMHRSCKWRREDIPFVLGITVIILVAVAAVTGREDSLYPPVLVLMIVAVGMRWWPSSR